MCNNEGVPRAWRVPQNSCNRCEEAARVCAAQLCKSRAKDPLSGPHNPFEVLFTPQQSNQSTSKYRSWLTCFQWCSGRSWFQSSFQSILLCFRGVQKKVFMEVWRLLILQQVFCLFQHYYVEVMGFLSLTVWLHKMKYLLNFPFLKYVHHHKGYKITGKMNY